MTEPSASGHTDVAASPEAVYALVSDLPGMAALAEELDGGGWVNGVAGAEVGARFRGHNRKAWHRWSTMATVTDAEPGRRFAFEVRSMGAIPVSRWQYDIRPTDEGCRVAEQTWDHRPSWFRPLANFVTGTRDRAETNRRNIARTLAQVKAAAEAARGQP